ncbi:hypothetical protein BCR42DRAFT_492258 [Absidia repens]|uniref:PH domain-containing protein n=1 Tax=Absidia repens TaxID=90262 RepID=A0A1X2IFF9_9FUNG|nr:hypothetical protein BCR42DRAFT_492258 [Absidia repens]
MIHTPKSAWLKKLTLTMGRPRWQSRYFVLLETEIRYYKDEYAATPNYIWSLRDIDHVKQVTMAGQNYCLSLEPTMTELLGNCTANKKKSLILCFQSAIDMKNWQQEIASRLTRLIPCAPLEVPLPSVSTSSTSSSSLGRRRGVILSALDISRDHHHVLPTLISPSASTVSILSSSSSISTTLYHQSSYSSLSSPHNTIAKESDDDSSSPTFLQYKNQFRL